VKECKSSIKRHLPVHVAHLPRVSSIFFCDIYKSSLGIRASQLSVEGATGTGPGDLILPGAGDT
jgi:hypothetical protein